MQMKFTSTEVQDIVNSHLFPLMLIFTNLAVGTGWTSIEKGGVSVFEVIIVRSRDELTSHYGYISNCYLLRMMQIDLYYLFRIVVIGIKVRDSETSFSD